MTPRLVIAILLGALAAASSPARAQNGAAAPAAPGQPAPSPPDPAAAPTGPTAESVEAERVKVQEELRVAQEAAAAITAENGAGGSFRAEQVQLLTRIDSLLGQTITAIEGRKTLAAQLRELEAGDLQSIQTEGAAAVAVPDEFKRGPEARPDLYVSFLYLEQLRNELAVQEQAQRSAADGLAAAKTAAGNAQKALETAEAARRLAREAVETNSDEAKTAELTTARELAVLRARVESATLQLRRAEQRSAEAALALADARLETARLRIEAIRPKIRFTDRDLESREDDLNKRINELRAQKDRIAREKIPADSDLQAQKRRNEETPGDPVTIAKVQAAQARTDTLARHDSSLDEQIARTQQRLVLWDRRYKTARRLVDEDQFRAWLAEAQQTLDEFETDREKILREVANDRQQIATIQDQIQSLDPAQDELRRALTRYKDELDRRVNLLAAELTQIELANRTATRLVQELEIETDVLTLRDVLDRIGDYSGAVWRFEFFSIPDGVDADGEEQRVGITVAKVVKGLALLVFGLVGIRLVARFLGRRVLPKLGLNESAAAALQAILYYVMLVTVVLAALSVVNVPLTAFAFLGGAIAIGIGFGGQQIANNFISGLILLAERPIRVGDWIELGDVSGAVQRIGARATIIRLPSSTELIVPNSRFLENNVVNWTLSDKTICRWFDVGVVYGTNLRDAVNLLKKAAEDHGRVVKNPAPRVLLKDFGDNAIIFTLAFTFRMQQPIDRLQIPSDIRMRIESLFSTAGIVIAFPQRDIHLDTARPLDIRLFRDPDAAGTPAGPEGVEIAANGAPAPEASPAAGNA